jgi:hypothetical protein
MNTELTNSELFLKRLLSKNWKLENFIIVFNATDKYSGTFSVSYISTGRQFTGHYMVMSERYKRPVEITLIALKSKFRLNVNGTIKATHFITSEGLDLPDKLNSIIDIY